MHEIITKRLENKREELRKQKESFDIFYTNQKNTSTFEQNAISQLLVMKDLKAEIAELELLQQMASFKK